RFAAFLVGRLAFLADGFALRRAFGLRVGPRLALAAFFAFLFFPAMSSTPGVLMKIAAALKVAAFFFRTIIRGLAGPWVWFRSGPAPAPRGGLVWPSW